MTIRWRAAIVPVFALLVLTATGSTAYADGRIGDPFDETALRTLVASTEDVDVRATVAADIDEDGDIDVVARTSTGLVVWINDGSGHLDAKPTRQGPIARDDGSAQSWSDDDDRREEWIQTDGVPPPLVTSAAHATPHQSSRLAAHARVSAAGTGALGFSAPRAPPALT